MQLRDWFFGLFGRRARTEEGGIRKRGAATHVVILDGTMSSLEPGRETNAGLTFKLLREVSRSANLTVYYEAGIQWRDWSGTWGVMTGKGINNQIERAYGVIASRYREGDQIVLIGYSRGAYAVRSLAGVIDMVGLVKSDCATVRVVRQAYRHYRTGARSPIAQDFRDHYCHPNVSVEAVAVWDTVKALGLRLLAAACVGVCGVTGMEASALFGMGAGVVAAIMLAAAKPPGALPAFVSVLVGDRYF